MTDLHKQSMNQIFLNTNGKPTKPPTVIWPISGLISCAGIIGKPGLLSHACTKLIGVKARLQISLDASLLPSLELKTKIVVAHACN